MFQGAVSPKPPDPPDPSFFLLEAFEFVQLMAPGSAKGRRNLSTSASPDPEVEAGSLGFEGCGVRAARGFRVGVSSLGRGLQL